MQIVPVPEHQDEFTTIYAAASAHVHLQSRIHARRQGTSCATVEHTERGPMPAFVVHWAYRTAWKRKCGSALESGPASLSMRSGILKVGVFPSKRCG
jgi:hypothetical protein